MASTPLYKRLRTRGTTFLAFPSASNDFNVMPFQEEYDISVNKFVLLNIPQSSDQTIGPILNFAKTDNPDSSKGINTYNFDPNSNLPVNYSEQLVESIRNYIANQDACFRETRLSVNKDFYNPKERRTPTEEIFWKWCRLHNIIDLEPAEHKVDWDKNMSDFDNPNSSTITNTDFFRKYLWKEREIRYYDCVASEDSDHVQVTINEVSKFKIGDKIYLSGSTMLSSLTGYSHEITNVVISTNTVLTLDTVLNGTGGATYSGICYLDYHKLVQYVGEIQATSKVQSSQQTFTEFTAMIPAHAGATPTILFEINNDTNYYPGLEIPILDEQIQDEIIGSEILSSPIRTNPSDYPGSYFGYFDTYDKTYKMSPGDTLRYSGEYYGVLKNNNVGLASDDYVEQLEDFNSDNIDGVCLDFDIEHYYRAQAAGSTVNNFDEFNSISINGEPPADFEFNAILWYYTIHDHTTDKTYTNLYGIEFLDNPDNDFGSSNDRTITLTKKLVTNSNQDGYSYIYNLNLDIKVDNDMLPLRYDPTSIYNIFGFDLYNKVMSNYVLLTEQFQVIIGEFMSINDEINKLKSLLYSQTDINEIKNRLRNMEDLLKMYQTNQFVNSDTVKINIDYTKNYPAMSFNVVNVDYSQIYNLYTSDIVVYNLEQSGSTFSSSVIIPVPLGKFLVNIYNDLYVDYSGTKLKVAFDKDLDFKQSVDIYIKADIALYFNELDVNLFFYDGTPNPKVEKLLFGPIETPTDIDVYDSTNPTGSTFNNSYYLNIETYIIDFKTGYTSDNITYYTGTTVTFQDALFVDRDWIYVEDFYILSGGTYVDVSGRYQIDRVLTSTTGSGGSIGAVLTWDTKNTGYITRGKPRARYYKGMKINILRIDSSDTSDISHRYQITKDFINTETIKY